MTTCECNCHVFDDRADSYDYWKGSLWCDTCRREHMSYKDFLKANKPLTNHLATPNAVPKSSRGDNPGYRFKVQELEERTHTVDLKRYKITPFNTLMKRRPPK